MRITPIGALLLAAAPVEAQDELSTVLVADGFTKPLCVTHAPGDPTRLFVVEKAGTVRVVRDGAVLATPFLDLTAIVNASTLEFGLLSLCFDPAHATNRRFYVHYTAGTNGDSHIARCEVGADPDLADPATLATVLVVPSSSPHHRGGWIGFGPEGCLYAALGDGGPQEDPFNHAQDLALLHGKIVRLDVGGDDFPLDALRNYRIPATNPYAGQAGAAPEIWASGLRNPWRCSFDRETHDLWIGDVGEYEREEIDVQPAGVGGLNYGWRCMEGTSCSPWGGCSCSDVAITPPIRDYEHALGRSVTCGYVYRGVAIPALVGAFVHGDYQSGRFWSLRRNGTSATDLRERTTELDPPGARRIDRPASFGEDALGEILVCDYLDGELYRIVPSTDATPPTATITFPTDAPTWITTSASIDLGGTATDDVEVTRVEWSIAGGASGPALGTANWSAPAVALAPGVNVITVTAFDAIGRSASDVLVVDRYSAPTTNCAGDGSGTPCPCGNVGGLGRGCASSLHPDGALLAATGGASVSNDTLRLEASGMSNAAATYFQGTAATNGGAGAVFGDGKRCAGGSVVRIASRPGAGGASAYPSAGDEPISLRGAIVAPPQTRTYQVWYRNAASFCTPSTFNLTNGVAVIWSS